MRCKDHKHLSAIKFPAYAQCKSDGAFYNVVIKDKTISFLSRNGKELLSDTLTDKLMSLCNYTMGGDVVLHCEILIKDNDGKILAREIGNGYISSLARSEETFVTYQTKYLEASTQKQKDKLKEKFEQSSEDWEWTANHIVFRCWDLVPYQDWLDGEWKLPYKQRFSAVCTLAEMVNLECFLPQESTEVNSLEEIEAIYAKYIAAGEEGVVVKNLDGIWKDSDSGSSDQIKLKEKKQCELEVIGYNTGDGEFKDGIGSVIAVSSDRKVKVNISGMARKDRGLEPVDPNDASKGLRLIEGFDLNHYTGSIITIEFNSLLRPKADGTSALFLPVIIEKRLDKTVADDYKTIASM